MPTLTIEPRDAGLLDEAELDIDFDNELRELMHSPQNCADTCKRTVCTLWCCQTLM